MMIGSEIVAIKQRPPMNSSVKARLENGWRKPDAMKKALRFSF
jgi:hypothetical protein